MSFLQSFLRIKLFLSNEPNRLFSQRRLFASKSAFVEVGQTAKIMKSFTLEDLRLFAKLTGDLNQIHFDSKFAANFGFSANIVHGALINGVISAVIGTILPGSGSILLDQQLRFPNPLYVNEVFTASVKVSNRKMNIFFCEYECITEDGKKVTDGMAKILYRPSA